LVQDPEGRPIRDLKMMLSGSAVQVDEHGCFNEHRPDALTLSITAEAAGYKNYSAQPRLGSAIGRIVLEPVASSVVSKGNWTEITAHKFDAASCQ
jgi:hypothetical protein